MKVTKKCGWCGKEFTTTSAVKKYCTDHCAYEAERARVKRQKDFIQAIAPIEEIHQQEYLTFSKTAVLMGCSRQYVYKLVGQGKLKASRLSSRMALIRRADIEEMLATNPYNRVLFGSKPKDKTTTPRNETKYSKVSVSPNVSVSQKVSKPSKVSVSPQAEEPLTYISGEDVMNTYKVKHSWLYASAKRNHIPICRIAGKNYYSKQHIEDCLGLSADVSAITDWLKKGEACEMFGIKKTVFNSYVHRHNVPTKREYGIVYYSQTHLAELLKPEDLNMDEYYTTEEVAKKYGLTKANVCRIVGVNSIRKKKLGVRNLLLKSDVERVMAERTERGL